MSRSSERRALIADLKPIDVAWAVFSVLNLVAIRVFPEWETVPFHFIWVSMTLLYGFRVWKMRTTIWTLAAIMIATGALIGVDIVHSAQPPDELTEVPLMAAMFLAMVWHARRRAEAMEQLQRISEENVQLLQREKRFVQDASHQLRTPITLALGHAEMIERQADGVTTEDAHIVVEELLRLRRIADLLLAIAAGQEGAVARTSLVDVGAMATDTVNRWNPVPRRWVRERLDPAMVRGDADQLQLVIDALIENAVEHTGPGDTIAIGTRRDGDQIVISVADSGTGIGDGDLDRIFDRFVSLDGGRHRQAGGMGLGLSLVKTVAEAHGGAVGVRSEVGTGSVFELRLPAVSFPAPLRAPAPMEPPVLELDRSEVEEALSGP
ncbi:MAG: sensor histidine kinase [Candidatus Velamenicoccus archaeovorus]